MLLVVTVHLRDQLWGSGSAAAACRSAATSSVLPSSSVSTSSSGTVAFRKSTHCVVDARGFALRRFSQ